MYSLGAPPCPAAAPDSRKIQRGLISIESCAAHWPVSRRGDESSFHGILFNVAEHIFIMCRITDEAIEIFSLPEGSFSKKKLVGQVGRISLPGMNQSAGPPSGRRIRGEIGARSGILADCCPTAILHALRLAGTCRDGAKRASRGSRSG